MIRQLALSFCACFLFSLCYSDGLQGQGPLKTLWAVDVGPEYTAIGGDFDSLFLWSRNEAKPDLRLPIPGTITNLKWRPDGKQLMISTQKGYSTEGKGLTALNTQTMDLQVLEGVSVSGARALGWNARGDLLAVGDNEGLLLIYDQNLKLIKQLDTGLRSITGLSWHPTKEVITLVSGKIANYDLEKGELQVWESRKEEMLLLSVAWHPSSEFFALADYGDYAKNYPAQLQFHQPDGSLIKIMLGSKAEYRNIQWTDDGGTLVTVSDAFRLWSKEGELIHSLPFEHLLWGLDFDVKHQEWILTDEKGQVLRVSKDGKELVGSFSPFGVAKKD